MKSTLYFFVPALACLAGSAQAAASCQHVSYTTCADRIVHYYDTETGQICDPLPCGGGRAPLRTDVPGCPAYKGTETRPTSASYLPCWKPSSSSSAPASAAATATPSTTTAVGHPTLTTPGGVVPTSILLGSSSNAPATTEPPSPSDSRDPPNSASGASQPQTSEPGTNSAGSLHSSLLAVVIGTLIARLVTLV